MCAIKKFENYVFGTEIEIISHHNPLTDLQKTAPQSAKLQRWALTLQGFDITHCPGAFLKNTDGLSRIVSDIYFLLLTYCKVFIFFFYYSLMYQASIHLLCIGLCCV